MGVFVLAPELLQVRATFRTGGMFLAPFLELKTTEVGEPVRGTGARPCQLFKSLRTNSDKVYRICKISEHFVYFARSA